MQVNFKEMEAARSNRSSSTDREEPEYDPKVCDAEMVDNTTLSEQDTSQGESSAYRGSCSQDITRKSEVTGRVDNDMEMILRRKIYKCGLGDIRVPETHTSGCSECEETDSDEDDDLCSTSSDDSEDSYNPLASGILPPVLPVLCLFVILFFLLYHVMEYTYIHLFTTSYFSNSSSLVILDFLLCGVNNVSY